MPSSFLTFIRSCSLRRCGRLIVSLGLLASLIACGAPKLSKPSGSETAERRQTYHFPRNPLPRPTRNQPKDVELLNLITRINRARENAAKGNLALARQLVNIPRQQIDRLPVAQQADWYRLHSQLAQDNGDLAALLISEQQLLVKIPAHSRIQHNTGLFARLLNFGQIEVDLTLRKLQDNGFALGWLKLIDTFTNLPAGYSQQKLEWQRWQKNHQGHSAERYAPEQIASFFNAESSSVSFALMLPFSGPFAPFGEAVATGFSQVAAHPANTAWQVNRFDVANLANLESALAQVVETGIQRVVGPLDKELAQHVWQDTRVNNQVALNYLAEQSAPPLPRGQLGLAIEDEAEWIAKLINRQSGLRVALLQQQGRVPARAAASLRAEARHMPEVFFFDDNKALVEQLEKALGINAYDIRQLKPALAEYSKKLKETSDPVQRRALREKNPAKRLRKKLQLDLLLVFADSHYAAQVIPLLDFYYADSVQVLSYSAAIDLTRAEEQKGLNGMYLVDLPAMNKSPREWHEWVGSDFATDRQFYRFYALGVDAALIAHNLERLAKVPGFRLRGATGRLEFNPHTHRIKRDLTLYRVNNGELVATHPQNLLDASCAPGEGAGERSCL